VLLKQTISKINKDPRDVDAKPTSITDDDIKDFQEWDYFPHYDRPQLDQGYYVKFDQLQGNRNTYYVSGLNGFETVEYSIRAGIDIVENYITSNSSSNSTQTAGTSSSTASSSTAKSGANGRLGMVASTFAVVFACMVGLGQL
jgi:hypothetical protein